MATLNSSTAITIRPAKDEEYLQAARVLYNALIPNPMIKHLISKVDQSTWLEFDAGEFKQSISEGYSSVLVARQIDTGELVGAAWSERFNKDHPPTLPSRQFPKGCNRKELDLLLDLEVNFKEESLAIYGDFVYVTEFGVAPTSRGQGIGKRMTELIIDHAKRTGLTIIILVASGKSIGPHNNTRYPPNHI
ncbi:hypothetical protein QFC22_006533 [Naganishia vaughanmartiniae]|uniref:Uncharacterized protein n=1 Tax=Naganishia vaughanmartiniae TaxID=1424756 RepID=A0ACC2WL18_9TREE|nr:hypothetical protein QFC22_006533 [Naganishia vaughanmartiniae]